MRQHQNTHESERASRASWTQDRGMHPEPSERASSASIRLSQQLPFNYLDGRRDNLLDGRTDRSIAQGLLKEEAVNHPRRRSPFNFSPLPDSRPFLHGADGQNDVPRSNQERNRRNRDTSNTWTDSSAGSEVEDVEDRTEFVKEYNRLAEKHGIRKLIPDEYESLDIDTVTVIGKHGSWIMRKLLRRTSSMQTVKTKTENRQVRHKRSVSDFSNKLRMRKEPLKDKPLKELVDICGRSLLYLPSEYAASSLSLPTCLRATAHYIVQHGITTRGIFRIPGSSSSILTLYNYYATVDECVDAICGTVRSPTLPEHLQYEAHDVASVFKKFLAGLPGGILQGSTNLFEALIGIQSHLHSDPEWTRTKQSKVRARLIALALGSVRSRLQRELICAVFGLLCMIGRAAELAPREDDRGRPLPTSGLMGYGALGIIFGPLLLGEALDSYEMRFANGGVIVFPSVSTPLPKDSKKFTTHRGKSIEEVSYAASRFDKVKVANGITEMLITHWRDVVRHMKGLGVLKTSKDHASVIVRNRGRSHLRPYASEVFALRKPPEWGADEQSIRRVQQTPSPSPLTPIQRHVSQSEPGPLNQHNDYLYVPKQRYRPAPPTAPVLSGSKSMGTLSPMVEEPAVQTEGDTTNSTSLFPQSIQGSRLPFRNRLPSNPLFREAVDRQNSPTKRNNSGPSATKSSSLLAEVARGLRKDARKLIGVQYDQEETEIAELPVPEDEEARRVKNTDHTRNFYSVSTITIDAPDRVEDALFEKSNQHSIELGAQTPSQSAKKDATPIEDLQPKSNSENYGVRGFQNRPPRSKVRNLFDEAERYSSASNDTRGHRDQGVSGSPQRKLARSRTSPWNKGNNTTASPMVVQTPLVPSKEQPEVLAIPQKSPENVGKEFKRGDQERPITTRIEVQRSSTPESPSIIQHDLNTPTEFKHPAQPILSHQGGDPKPIGKQDSPESPRRLAILRFEKWNQHNGSGIAETPKPRQDLHLHLEGEQALVSGRIRALGTHDPGSQEPGSNGIENTAQPIPHVTEKRKSNSGNGSANPEAVPVKTDLERVLQEEDSISHSALAEAIQSKIPDGRDTNINFDIKSPENPQSPAVVQLPAKSETPDCKGGAVLPPEDAMPGMEEENRDEAVGNSPAISNLRSERSSEDQRSDASNATVLLVPRKRAHDSKHPAQASSGSSGNVIETSIPVFTEPIAPTVSERSNFKPAGSFAADKDTSNAAAALSPDRVYPQDPFLESPRDGGVSINNSPDSASQSPSAQTNERQRPVRAGSVLALAAKFDNPEPLSPVGSPMKRGRPRGMVRHSLFQPVNRLASNYTSNIPSPPKLTYPERSDVRAVRNPLQDRSPEAQLQRTLQKATPSKTSSLVDRHSDAPLQKTPQKEISPMYRTPQKSGMKDSDSPSTPFSFSKTPVPMKRRILVDGNDSLTSQEIRSPGLHKSNMPIPNNPSQAQALVRAITSPSIRKSLGSRSSTVGTVLPHPAEPPVDQHIPFVRPPSTPRYMERDHEIIRITSPSGNAALYEQIRKLQRQLESARDELTQYKSQVESRGSLQELGTLSEQLRECKRECRAWRARAELAERRLEMSERMKKDKEKGHIEYDGDGTRDSDTHHVATPNTSSEISNKAVFNENSRGGYHQSNARTLNEDTDCAATASTDSEIWVKGGTATITRGKSTTKEEFRGSFDSDYACEEKITIGDMVLGMRSTTESDRNANGLNVDGDEAFVEVFEGKGKRRLRYAGKRMGGEVGDSGFGSEWSLVGEFAEIK